jgi:hypothetical protein
MTWLVKNYEDRYVAEVSPGTVWFCSKQREAKRFKNPTAAARIALKWGDDEWKVVKLVPKRVIDVVNPTTGEKIGETYDCGEVGCCRPWADATPLPSPAPEESNG